MTYIKMTALAAIFVLSACFPEPTATAIEAPTEAPTATVGPTATSTATVEPSATVLPPIVRIREKTSDDPRNFQAELFRGAADDWVVEVAAADIGHPTPSNFLSVQAGACWTTNSEHFVQDGSFQPLRKRENQACPRVLSKAEQLPCVSLHVGLPNAPKRKSWSCSGNGDATFSCEEHTGPLPLLACKG